MGREGGKEREGGKAREDGAGEEGRTSCRTPREVSFSEKTSEASTLVVPTSTGRSARCISIIEFRAAFDLPRTVLNTELGTSTRCAGSTGGTASTGRL